VRLDHITLKQLGLSALNTQNFEFFMLNAGQRATDSIIVFQLSIIGSCKKKMKIDI